MRMMFESLECRRLLSAAVADGIGDAVQAHAEAVVAVRADLATRRDAIKDVAAGHRETLRELIDSRRTVMRELIASIRAAKGDAEARADLKAQLADLRAQFKADLAAARAASKDALTGARSGLKAAAGAFREAAAQLVSDVHELKTTLGAVPGPHAEPVRELVTELKAIGRERDGAPTADRVREIVGQIREALRPDPTFSAEHATRPEIVPPVDLPARPQTPVGPPETPVGPPETPVGPPETPVGPPETPPDVPPGPPVTPPALGR